MATTADNPPSATTSAAPVSAATVHVESPASGAALARLVLLAVVFIGGASVMTVEMAASRLLAPYFGTSLFIWANLIGLVMVYLTLGYFLGGKLADRYPRASVLYTITAIAGLAVGLIPLFSRPILSWSLRGFSENSVGIFYGSLIGVILLFSVPLLLLGFVSPFAVRLRMTGVGNAGGTAGAISALSTLGSILGTFGSVFLLIPYIGTAATLYLASAALLVFSVIGLATAGAYRAVGAAALFLLVTLGLALFAPRGIIKPPEYGELLHEKESAYNYIQVVKYNGDIRLVLNEGHATHSQYNPDRLLTGGPWDYWLVAPYFNRGFEAADMQSMAMIGSAAGTAAHIFTEVYGPLRVDGVEIDPEIVEIGKRYFNLDAIRSNTTHVQDGRTYLLTDGKEKKWSVVGIDAYRQPYIPFHLTTREFFEEVGRHLTPDGAVMINAGRTRNDTRLVSALANTMLQVYPHVYVIDVPTLANSMVVGTFAESSIEDFKLNAERNGSLHPALAEVFTRSIERGDIREVKPDPDGIIFTDDKAPVEEVINQMILEYIDQAQ